MFIDELNREYDQKYPLYNLLCQELVTQINVLLNEQGITAILPIEKRVKSWNSISEKCRRNQIEPKSLNEINDIVGLRIISLFQRDIDAICSIVKENFQVIREEDTRERLAENQFGYGSIHFEVNLKEPWFSLPTLKNLKGLKAEIQIRTASQHIWAASSHVLQYKQEAHVPLPLRRTINRVAALLETVDLEFERVLVEREDYIRSADIMMKDIELNTDSLRAILDKMLPAENKQPEEDYADLLNDLKHFGIITVEQLENLLSNHMDEILQTEAEYVRNQNPERGVYFRHVGLARIGFSIEFGEEFENFREEIALKRETVKNAQES